MNSRSPLDPETRGDARDEERRARALAEYHEWLVAGLTLDSPHDGGASNDDLSQAQDCLELIERVRRREAQSPRASEQTGPTDSFEKLSHDGLRRIGRFEIVRRLGGGGYGVVFLAHDPRLNRPVALKVPAPDVLLHSELKRRFLRESEAAAVLEHPHIVTVYEAGEMGPICYMALRYCPGPTLSDWLRKRASPVPPDAAARLVKTLADAVQHAHSRGVLHRDLKPSNVLLESADGSAVSCEELDACARLSDFGLAKQLASESDHTRSHAIVGTPAYMSPEQAEGRSKEVGTATDIYSLGVILYELLTGHTPFQRKTSIATLQAVRYEELAPPSRLVADLPRDLEAICLKCLEKPPERRYHSAAALAEDLERWLSGESIAARRPTRAELVRRWCRRNRALAGLLSLVAVLMLLLATGGTVSALWLNDSRNRALDHLERERLAKEQARRNEELAIRAVYDARRAQGRAERFSGKPGQRVESLQALAAAAKQIPRLDLGKGERLRLRNEAIASMTLVDLTPDKQWPPMPPRDRVVATDARIARYAHAEKGCKAILVRRMDDNELVSRLTIAGECTQVRMISFSGEGRHLAAWCRPPRGPYTVQVWALGERPSGDEALRGPPPDRTPVVTLPAVSSGQARPMDFSPDERWLAAVLPDGAIGLLSVPDFEQQARFEGSSYVEAVRFGPAARFLAVARGGRIELFEVDSGTLWREISCGSFVFQLSFSPDGRWLAAGCDDKRVLLWDVETGEPRGSFSAHGAQVTHLDFHPNGQILATTSYDRTTRLWDVARLKQLLEVESDFTGFSRDGRWMGGGEARFQVVLPEEYQVLDVPLRPGNTTSAARRLSVDPTARLLAVSNRQQFVIFELATGRALASRRATGGHVAFTRDGRWLLAAGRSGLQRFPVRWTESDGTIEVTIGPGQRLAPTGARRLAASDDGNTIAAVDRFDRPKIVVHDLPEESTRTLRPHQNARWLSISPDGRLLATGAWHGRDVKVWNAETGELHKTLPSGNARVRFGPSGEQLVVDEGSHVTVYRVSDWKRLVPKTAKSIAAVPGPIAFSPDGCWLAILDSPRVVRLLDAVTFDELASFRLAGEEFVDSLIFDPQCSRLIAGTTDPGTVHIWRLNRIREKLRSMQLDWTSAPLPRKGRAEFRSVSIRFDFAEPTSATAN